MVKYYGQFNPPIDQVIHERYFKNKYNGVAIECGAFDGLTECSCKFFEENYNWKTINIEPLPNVFENLIKNRPNSINLNIALSNNNEDKIFKNYKHPRLGYEWGNGSLNHTDAHERELKELCGNDNYITHSVKCNTYSEIIENLNIQSLDLFVLDVEGHEYNVIDSMVGCDILPDVFVIEHGHTDSSDLLNKLNSCLNAEYKLDHVSFVNSFFIKSTFKCSEPKIINVRQEWHLGDNIINFIFFTKIKDYIESINMVIHYYCHSQYHKNLQDFNCSKNIKIFPYENEGFHLWR